jgi:hypothetical protein
MEKCENLEWRQYPFDSHGNGVITVVQSENEALLIDSRRELDEQDSTNGTKLLDVLSHPPAELDPSGKFSAAADSGDEEARGVDD